MAWVVSKLRDDGVRVYIASAITSAPRCWTEGEKAAERFENEHEANTLASAFGAQVSTVSAEAMRDVSAPTTIEGWSEHALAPAKDVFAEMRSHDEAASLAAVIRTAEKYGYGNVMQCVSEAWRSKDPHGAFAYGPCFITLEKLGCDSPIALVHKYESLLAAQPGAKAKRTVSGYVIRSGLRPGAGGYWDGDARYWTSVAKYATKFLDVVYAAKCASEIGVDCRVVTLTRAVKS